MATTTTKAAVRRRAVFLARADGRRRGLSSPNGVTALTATGGTTATLIDTAGLPPVGVSPLFAKRHWLNLPSAVAAGDRKRIIDSYTPASYTLNLKDPVLAVAPVAGTPYLILKDDPDTWNAAMDEAFRTMLSEVHYDEITIGSTPSHRYDLSAAPFSLPSITKVTQVYGIELRRGDATDPDWDEWQNGSRAYKVYSAAGKIYLDFGTIAAAPGAADVIRVKWAAEYDVTTTEAASINCNELLAAQATLIQMADWLADSDNPADDWNIIGLRTRVEYAALRRELMGADAYRRVERPSQGAGRLRMRGRGGR